MTLTPSRAPRSARPIVRRSARRSTARLARSPACPIKANLNLPDSVVFGLSQVINDQWQAHLGVEWTNWSRFRNIPIVSQLNGLPATSLNFQYDDSLVLQRRCRVQVQQ